MRSTLPRPFPFDPLRRVAVRHAPENQWAEPSSNRTVAIVLGAELHHVRRWAERGLTLEEADRLAILLHEHPSVIWPEEWAGVDDAEDDEDDAEDEPIRLEIVSPEPLIEPELVPCSPSGRACCTCQECGPVDHLAMGGCSPWCLPCSFEVCGCRTDS